MINKIVFQEGNSESTKALFVDRDGVINIKPVDHDYVKSWEEFSFVNGIENLLKKYFNDGFKIFVITNQRGISRRLVKQSLFNEISRKMAETLKKQGVIVSAVYYCPHGEQEGCGCRKPKPGLITAAVKDYNINISQSILIGDSDSDIKAGRSAHLGKLILVETNSQKILSII